MLIKRKKSGGLTMAREDAAKVRSENSLDIKDLWAVENGCLWTTSLKIAQAFGKDHRNVLRDIRELECSAEFSLLNFEPRDYVDERGKTYPMFRIRRDGFSFLAMGFTGKVAAEWKEKFIFVFNEMEQKLLKETGWLDERISGKKVRAFWGEAVKEFVEYAQAQGSKNAAKYYGNITDMQYHSLFTLEGLKTKGLRERISKQNLRDLATAEDVAIKWLRHGMALGLPYKDVYKLAKAQVEKLVSVVGQKSIAKETRPLLN